MTRYSGLIGFATKSTETTPGVWTEGITERKMTGDVLDARLSQSIAESVNPSLTINNRVSVVGDRFSFENYSSIRYAEYLGQKWAVTSIQVLRPRLILQLGGPWNE